MMPVKIRGTTYRSIADAARDIGVNPSTIRYALDRGTIDSCGLVFSARSCTVNGVSYPSMAAAGRATGVTTEAIRQRINRLAKKKAQQAVEGSLATYGHKNSQTPSGGARIDGKRQCGGGV